jgi:single-stranded-DNA-specific exonuclease
VLAETVWRSNTIGDDQTIADLADEMNQSKTFIRLCMTRGLTTKEDIVNFMTPSEEWFHDPFELKDMDKTIERIQKAIELHQKITVYGDYDADGVTSTTILYEAIEMLGGHVDYFIPNRFIEGYGPNVSAFERLIDQGTELIVTVDNGIAGHDAINRANDLGIDVIVTDHHECPDTLPEAYSIVHPKHPEGSYPFKELAGAGVSLKVAQALLGELPEEMIELAMIGTIADVVSLTDENRALAYFGLKLIKQTQRVGLLSLLKQAEITREDIDEETIGFKLAPPINAVGRLGDATMVVDLLTTFDEEKAEELSGKVLEKNSERKSIVSQITEEALSRVDAQQNDQVIVLKDEKWHQGVLGIVASKVTEKTGKPALIFSVEEDTGMMKGSGRSVSGFNLFDCMQQTSHLLSSFGGHEMACGVSLELTNLEAFHVELQKSAKNLAGDKELKTELTIDVKAEWEDLSVDLITELDQLRPFGQDNRKPLFNISSVIPEGARLIGANQDHLKSLVTKNNTKMDLIAFGASDWFDVFKSQPEIDVAGYVSINEWNGNRKVQIQAVDFKSREKIVIDKRQSILKPEVFQDPKGHYLFFQKAVYTKWKEQVHPDATCQLVDTNTELYSVSSTNKIIVVDMPDQFEFFRTVYRNYVKQCFYLYLYSPNEYYFKGMPKHSTFSALYKWLRIKETIDLSKDTRELVTKLKIDKEVAKFMLMVFLENEFVTIEDGKVSVVADPAPKKLEDTKTYKRRLEQIAVEEKLVYSSFNELMATLNEID